MKRTHIAEISIAILFAASRVDSCRSIDRAALRSSTSRNAGVMKAPSNREGGATAAHSLNHRVYRRTSRLIETTTPVSISTGFDGYKVATPKGIEPETYGSHSSRQVRLTSAPKTWISHPPIGSPHPCLSNSRPDPAAGPHLPTLLNRQVRLQERDSSKPWKGC